MVGCMTFSSGAGHTPTSSTAQRQRPEHHELAAVQVLRAPRRAGLSTGPNTTRFTSHSV